MKQEMEKREERIDYESAIFIGVGKDR